MEEQVSREGMDSPKRLDYRETWSFNITAILNRNIPLLRSE